MRWSSEKKVAGGFFIAFVSLAIIRLVSYDLTTGLMETSDAVDHRRKVAAEIGALYSGVQDAESAQRGYLLVSSEAGDLQQLSRQSHEYLQPYFKARDNWRQQLSALKDLTRGEKAQFDRADDLEQSIRGKFDEMDQTLAARNRDFKAAVAIVLSDRGQQAMDHIRQVLRDMSNHENDRLAQSAMAAQRSRRAGIIGFAALTGLDFLLLGVAFYYVSRYSRGRRTSEAAMARQLAFTRAISTSMGEGVCVVDAQGRLTFMNPAAERMLGWPQGELLGKNLHATVHYQRADGTPIPPEQSSTYIVPRTRQTVKNDDDVIWRRDGKVVPIAYTSSPIFDGDTVSGTVLAFRDITDQKRAEHELRRAKDAAESASRLKSLFLANMSHELRTPLNAIIGYSEMMLEESDGATEQQLSDIRKIHQAGKQLLALINDILDLSKIESGKMSVYLETFDVGSMMQDVAATIKPLVTPRGNALVVEAPADLGKMRSDRSKVRQCLFNLLTNALKFTDHGTVRFSAERTHSGGREWITLRVSDTGIGMTQAQMAHLFQAFMQAEKSTSSKYGGTGLGLAISRQFCRMLGGDISVQSEMGAGSTFTLVIPAEAEIRTDGSDALLEESSGELDSTGDVNGAASRRSASSGTDAAAAAGDRESSPRAAAPVSAGRVLVIDDDAAVRELLGRSLAADGFDVRSAATGEEGLALARDWKPLAITLDVLMPGMDGWAVLRTLKAEPVLADVPVIMLSIVGDQNRALGIALGASEFMTKPVDRGRLARLLDHYRHGVDTLAVLIVEDDAAIREMMRRTLASEGWPVIEAADGRAALARLGEQIPAVILLDLMMPEMDGFAFVNELRQHEAWKQIPVVVVTARELSDEDRLKLNGRVEKILAKASYSREELLAEVSRMVRDCSRTAANGV